MRSFSIVLVCLTLFSVGATGQEQPGPEATAFLNRVSVLDQQGKLEDAIRLLDEGLERYTKPDYDRYFTLNYKYRLLVRLHRDREAVRTAVEKAEIIKSPKQALVVATAYLRVHDSDHALEWIERSVDRGLQSYQVFDEEIYAPLRGNPRLAALIETVKKRNGIGRQAVTFVRQAVSGHEISLAGYRGKVLLVDFWATFCPPCREELPRLKRYYEKYHPKGFEIVGFSLDVDDSQLHRYLEEHAITWENVFCPDGERDETVSRYAVVNIPASFLVDRKGIVRGVNLTGEQLEQAIRALVDE